MRKLVVKEWMTLDGVIDAESMHQWFIPYDSPERRAHIKEGLERSDAYLLGRVTYEMLAPHWSQLPDEAEGGHRWPVEPPPEVCCVVLLGTS
jgi:dihydrofolate reductase